MITSYNHTGGIYIALNAQGLAVGYVKGIGVLSEVERLTLLESNARTLKPPNPKVEQRIRDRLKRRVKRRREVRLIDNER